MVNNSLIPESTVLFMVLSLLISILPDCLKRYICYSTWFIVTFLLLRFHLQTWIAGIYTTTPVVFYSIFFPSPFLPTVRRKREGHQRENDGSRVKTCFHLLLEIVIFLSVYLWKIRVYNTHFVQVETATASSCGAGGGKRCASQAYTDCSLCAFLVAQRWPTLSDADLFLSLPFFYVRG